jgi:dUTP pyrophosphatase
MGETTEIEIIVDNAECIPKKAHEIDAGYDLKMNSGEALRLRVGNTYKICTGAKFNIPEGYAGIVVPRSGLGTTYGVRLANTAGIIDAGYQGEIFVYIDVKKPYVLKPYERFAQLIIIPIPKTSLKLVRSFSTKTDRGEGGFGHTGQLSHRGIK